MERLNEENREANMRTVWLNASYFPAVELLSAVGTAGILLFGGYQVIEGNVEIGVLISFVGYLATFFDPIQQISQLYTTYQQGMAALDKIFDLLDTEPDTVDRPGAIDPGEIRGEIRLEGVWFSYSEDARRALAAQPGAVPPDPDAPEPPPGWALQDIDLTILPGQTVALVGETGAGKSTLAKLVARFYDPQRGRITVDGHDVRDLDATALRSRLGIVPQEGFLFSGTMRGERRLRPARRQRGGDRRGAAHGRRDRDDRRPARRPRDRGRRARHASSRPASGRSSPSPAHCSRSRRS